MVLLPADPAGAGRKVPRGLFGYSGWEFPSEQEISVLSREGLRSWRVTVSWADVERDRGVYAWSGYDQLVASLTSRRIRLLFTLTACPRWACDGPGPPRTPEANSAWQAFVANAVRRYGAGGEFWRDHPELPHRPVRYWQIMNEVNGEDQWPNPSAADYAAFLKQTTATIRSADPLSRVVLAGLGEKMTIWLRSYLPALYRQPGFAGDFDVMAIEAYAPRPQDIPRIFRTTRRAMRRGGDLAKPVWITEMSWATGGGSHAFITSLGGQEQKLRRAWNMFLACRKRWNLKRVFWFPHRDLRPPAGATDYWGYHNGLITVDGGWKPAFRTSFRYLHRRLPGGHRAANRCKLPRGGYSR
jgi:hypothetical protein